MESTSVYWIPIFELLDERLIERKQMLRAVAPLEQRVLQRLASGVGSGVGGRQIRSDKRNLEGGRTRWKPAHTEIIFDYSGLTTGGDMAGTP
jgi:hypothetical protein